MDDKKKITDDELKKVTGGTYNEVTGGTYNEEFYEKKDKDYPLESEPLEVWPQKDKR